MKRVLLETRLVLVCQLLCKEVEKDKGWRTRPELLVFHITTTTMLNPLSKGPLNCRVSQVNMGL